MKRRAIESRRFGHVLFWTLKQEQERLSVNKSTHHFRARITMMLESYVQFSGHVGAVDKWTLSRNRILLFRFCLPYQLLPNIEEILISF